MGTKNPSTAVSDSGCRLQAGRLQQFVPAWKEITNDPDVLDWVEHRHIEVMDNALPIQYGGCRSIKFNDKESAIIGAEIAKLLDKGVVVESAPSEGDSISPV